MPWSNKAARFVAFFDILGFKEMMLRESHDAVAEKLIKIHKISDMLHDKEGSNEVLLRRVKFSDSVVLITNDDSNEAGKKIIQSSAWLLAGALARSVPMKGAIAHGLFTADFENSLYFGQPIIDAYLLQDELKLYGCILHHTAEAKLNDLGRIKENNLCIEYNTPMASGLIKHVNLNWVDPMHFHEVNISEAESKLYNTVSGRPRKYVDNTCDFSRPLKENNRYLPKQTGLLSSLAGTATLRDLKSTPPNT